MRPGPETDRTLQKRELKVFHLTRKSQRSRHGDVSRAGGWATGVGSELVVGLVLAVPGPGGRRGAGPGVPCESRASVTLSPAVGDSEGAGPV